MGKVVDMLGKQCGRLHVDDRGPDYIDPVSGYHRAQWWCTCSCGNTVLVTGKNLRSGRTKSCGCYVRERCAENGRANSGINHYEFNGSIVTGYSQQGEEFYFDYEDYERVSKFYWYKHHSGYIFAKHEGKQIALHRLIMNASEAEVVDHINHQKENCCKANLRMVSIKQNGQNKSVAKNNTSGFTGVSFNRNRGKRISRLMKDGVSKFLGAFDNIEDAIDARKAAEEKFFGEFSYCQDIL